MARPIRVLHVFAGLNRGGAEAALMNLYRHVDRSILRFDFVVRTTEDGVFDKEISRLGGKIYVFPPFVVKNLFGYRNHWLRFFREHKEYSVIHGHAQGLASVYLSIAKKHGLKTIAHSHTVSNGKEANRWIKWIFQLPLRSIADYRLACCPEAGRWLFGKTASFQVMPNSIPTEKCVFRKEIREKVRSELGISDSFVVGHVGRFTKAKNHPYLLKVFAALLAMRKNARLLLIGEGPCYEEIRKESEKAGLQSSVLFLNEQSSVFRYLMAMDVFVFPSLYEGFPVALLEAQASGLPCMVSNRVSENIRVTPLVSFLSIRQKPKEWARALLEASTGSNREQWAQAILEAGYDSQEQAQAYTAWIRKITGL